jgi:hypothetical protein
MAGVGCGEWGVKRAGAGSRGLVAGYRLSRPKITTPLRIPSSPQKQNARARLRTRPLLQVIACEMKLEPQLQARAPQLQAREPQLQAREPQLQAREPQLQARRPQLQARRPQLQARRPQLQARRPQLQARGTTMFPRINRGRLASFSPSRGWFSTLLSRLLGLLRPRDHRQPSTDNRSVTPATSPDPPPPASAARCCPRR